MYLQDKSDALKNNGSICVYSIHGKPSISIVLLKTVAIHCMMIVVIFTGGELHNILNSFINTLFDVRYLYLVALLADIVLSTLLIMEWSSEEYIITPLQLVHKKGVIFKHEEYYSYRHITEIEIQQGIMGKFLNYGSIEMYDRYIDKHINIYQIHNPLRYFKLLESLIPFVDQSDSFIRESVIETPDRFFGKFSHIT